MFGFKNKREAGYIVMATEGNGIIESATRQCPHCGGHWEIKPSKAKTIHWCANCDGEVCGKPGCFTCYPFEKKMEDYEKGKLLILD